MKQPVHKEEVIETKASPAAPADTAWIEFQQKEKQDTLKRLEEAAKYLSGLASVCLSIILGVNKDALAQLSDSAGMKAGIVSWLASILLTLAVVFPFPYSYVENSADSIRKMNADIGRIKFILLIAGAALFVTGIAIVSWYYLCCQAPVPKPR